MASMLESRNSEILEEVWNKAIANTDQLTTDPNERRFLKSIAMGSTVATEITLNSCTEIQSFWGEGSIDRAKEISLLFSSIMLGQCYRWLNSKPAVANTAYLPKEVTATKLIYIFDGEPEQGMDDFIHFDAQFNCDLDRHPHLVHLSSLLLARISEICGHQCINWSKVKFPVVELTHIMKKGIVLDGVPMRNQSDINAVTQAITTGIEAMTRFHDGA
jgi:hypothetical protein